MAMNSSKCCSLLMALCLSVQHALADSNPTSEKIAQIRKDANQGDSSAQAQLAELYRYGKGLKKDYQQSFQWASKAAEQGHAKAQHYLGICYTYEIGVKKDVGQAFHWFKKAADQGYAAGQYRVGECYLHGDGVPRNDDLGVEWLEKSANQGDADAKLLLGKHYARKAVKKLDEFNSPEEKEKRLLDEIKFGERFTWISDPHEELFITAYMWFSLAAADGNEDAKKCLDGISKLMDSDSIKHAQKLSTDWKPKP